MYDIWYWLTILCDLTPWPPDPPHPENPNAYQTPGHWKLGPASRGYKAQREQCWGLRSWRFHIILLLLLLCFVIFWWNWERLSLEMVLGLIESRTCFDQGSRPHLRVSHVQISCFCIWHCVRLAMTLQNRLHCWFVFIDFSLQEACCPRWWEAAITNSSCLAEKVAVWLRASLIGILQKVVDCLRGVATTGFYHLFILFGVHKTFHDPGNQGVSWSFWDLSHVNMLHFHMNPSVPVASRSNQAGHRVDIDMEIPAENDQGFISFILWCILWLTAIRIKNLYFEVIRKMRYSYSLSLGLMGPVHGRGGAGFGAMRPRVATWRMCKMLEQGASRGGN